MEMVLVIFALPTQAHLTEGALRAERWFVALKRPALPVGDSPYQVLGGEKWGATEIGSTGRWRAAVRKDGTLALFGLDTPSGGREETGSDLSRGEREAACARAYRQSGGAGDLYFDSTEPSLGDSKTLIWAHDAFVRQEEIVYLDRDCHFEVGAATGNVYFFSSWNPLYDRADAPRLSGSAHPRIGAEAARSAVAAVAFAWGRDPMKKGVALPASTVEEARESVLAAWSPRSRRLGRGDYQGLTEADRTVAGQGEARLVWWLRLRAYDEALGMETSYSAKVDAGSGRIIDLSAGISSGGFGAQKPSSARATVLSGRVALSVKGKAKTVHLVPVAVTRAFAAGGKALVSVGKRIVEADYDPKAGLVRFRGKLARTLEP